MNAYRTLPALVLTVLLTAVSGCVSVREVTGPSASDRPSTAVTASPDDVVIRSVKDVERFWTAQYPALSDGDAFKAVQGGLHPYTSTDLPSACGGEQTSYQPNAFRCPDGDFIAWDAETLIPQLRCCWPWGGPGRRPAPAPSIASPRTATGFCGG